MGKSREKILLVKKHNKVYIKKKGNAQSQFGRLHVRIKSRHENGQLCGGFIFYSLSFFFRKESNAITVLATVATQVTTAITNSKVITSLPIQLFQQKPIRVGRHRLKLGISNNQSMTQFNQNVYNFVKYYYI